MAAASAHETATKKSFFKRPTWATNAPLSESRDFFRHSDIVYDSILRDKERRREKHAQKKQAKAGSEVADESRDTKRRRISTDEEIREEDGRSDSETASSSSWREATPTTDTTASRPKSPTTSSSLAPARNTAQPESSLTHTTAVESHTIRLDSDDDTGQVQAAAPKKIPAQISDEEVSEDEDEYLLQLKQKAREKARMKKLGTDPAGRHSQASAISKIEQRPHPSSGNRPQLAQPQMATTTSPKTDETIVQILITTEIPNTNKLLVNRRVSQPMQQVRQVWCSRQNFSEEMTASVIFTWRGKRLYDTTTSMHLLNVLKKEHARKMGGLIEYDEDDPSNGMIQVEAITKDMYDQKMMRRSLEGTEADANDTADTGVRDGQSRERSTTPQKAAYTVVMNAQGLEALYLKVRPNTSIERMMAAFKKMRETDPEKTCWLVFDGERLEPESTVADTEIEDGDAVEVYVR